jgi:hypothetical protein
VVGPVLGADDALARVRHLLDDLEAARGIDAGAIARQAAQGADRAGASTAIAQAVRAARLAALARAVGPRGPAPDDLPDPLPQGLADRLGTDQGKAP